MVGQMTYGKRQFESIDGTIRQVLPTLYNAMIESIPMIDADTDAFNDYMVFIIPHCTGFVSKLSFENSTERDEIDYRP